MMVIIYIVSFPDYCLYSGQWSGNETVQCFVDLNNWVNVILDVILACPVSIMTNKTLGDFSLPYHVKSNALGCHCPYPC